LGIDICSNGWRRLENLSTRRGFRDAGRVKDTLAPRLGDEDDRSNLEDDYDDDEGSFLISDT